MSSAQVLDPVSKTESDRRNSSSSTGSNGMTVVFNANTGGAGKPFMPSSNSNIRITQTAFIHKLYSMLEDPTLKHLIWWTPTNDSFIILPGEEFSKVLSQYFKHTNVSSFVRQLNMYGFHKVNDNFHGSNSGGAPAGSSGSSSNYTTTTAGASNSANQTTSSSNSGSNPTSAGAGQWEFRHGANSFRRGDIDGLLAIRRRTSRHSTGHRDVPGLKSVSISVPSTPPPVDSFQQQQQSVHHQQQQQQQQKQQQPSQTQPPALQTSNSMPNQLTNSHIHSRSHSQTLPMHVQTSSSGLHLQGAPPLHPHQQHTPAPQYMYNPGVPGVAPVATTAAATSAPPPAPLHPDLEARLYSLEVSHSMLRDATFRTQQRQKIIIDILRKSEADLVQIAEILAKAGAGVPGEERSKVGSFIDEFQHRAAVLSELEPPGGPATPGTPGGASPLTGMASGGAYHSRSSVIFPQYNHLFNKDASSHKERQGSILYDPLHSGPPNDEKPPVRASIPTSFPSSESIHSNGGGGGGTSANGVQNIQGYSGAPVASPLLYSDPSSPSGSGNEHYFQAAYAHNKVMPTTGYFEPPARDQRPGSFPMAFASARRTVFGSVSASGLSVITSGGSISSHPSRNTSATSVTQNVLSTSDIPFRRHTSGDVLIADNVNSTLNDTSNNALNPPSVISSPGYATVPTMGPSSVSDSTAQSLLPPIQQPHSPKAASPVVRLSTVNSLLNPAENGTASKRKSEEAIEREGERDASESANDTEYKRLKSEDPANTGVH